VDLKRVAGAGVTYLGVEPFRMADPEPHWRL
jgi:hypothetical protein